MALRRIRDLDALYWDGRFDAGVERRIKRLRVLYLVQRRETIYADNILEAWIWRAFLGVPWLFWYASCYVYRQAMEFIDRKAG